MSNTDSRDVNNSTKTENAVESDADSVWKRLSGVKERVGADPRFQAVAARTMSTIRDERTRKTLRTIGGTVSAVAITAVARHVTRGFDPTGAMAAQISDAVSGRLMRGASTPEVNNGASPQDPTKPNPSAPQEKSTGVPVVEFLPPADSPASARYPTSPQKVELNWNYCGQVYKHPDLPDVWIEVSMLMSRKFELAIEWNGRCKRFWLAPADLSSHWQRVVYGPEIKFPLELCATGPDTIMFRWTEHTLADVHANSDRPVVERDPRITEVNMKEYLRKAMGFERVRY